MIKMRLLTGILWCALLCLSTYVNAQETSRIGIRWHQIENAGVRIIYPSGNYNSARAILNRVNQIADKLNDQINAKVDHLDIVLQGRSSISNGFVSFAPRYSEFFAGDPQEYTFLGNNSWYDLLAIHEFRHVLQLDASRVGDNAMLHTVGGEGLAGILAGLAVPEWFWEGDAVVAETEFSKSGRGRSPSFDMILRANTLERGIFRYHKQATGSYRYPMPSHYILGYHMVSYLREHSSSASSDLLFNSFYRPWVPLRFSYQMKKITGKKMRKSYHEMMNTFKDRVKQQIAASPQTSFDIVNERKRSIYHSYRYPQVLANGNIIALETGMDRIPKIVSIDKNRKVRKLFTPGPFNDVGFLSAKGSKVTWTEYGFHPRWEAESYSNICVFDEQTKKLVKTKRGNYHGSSLSPDQSTLIVVKYLQDQTFQLVTMSSGALTEIQQLPVEQGVFYSMFRFTDRNDEVIGLKHIGSKKFIITIDLVTKQETIWHALGDIDDFENFGHPIKHDNWIFYSSGLTGVDNLFAIDCKNQVKYQVTNAKYGAFNPAYHDGYMYYNEFTVNGYDIVNVKVDPNKWKKIAKQSNVDRFGSTFANYEDKTDIIDEVPDHQFNEEDYKRTSSFLKPYYYGIQGIRDNGIYLGLLTRDRLNNLDMGFGVGLRGEEDNSGIFGFVSGTYQGFFPKIDFDLEPGTYSAVIRNDADDPIDTVRYEALDYYIGLRLPFILTSSKYNRFMSFTSGIRGYNETNKPGRSATNETEWENTVILTNALKTNARDLISPFSQFAVINAGLGEQGFDIDANVSLSFPSPLKLSKIGLFRNHVINVSYSDMSERFVFNFEQDNPTAIAEEVQRMTMGYVFPISYPDVEILPWVLLKRVSGNIFYTEELNKQMENYLGAQLWFDVNFFRRLWGDVRIITTYSRELNDNNYSISFGFAVNSRFINRVLPKQFHSAIMPNTANF